MSKGDPWRHDLVRRRGFLKATASLALAVSAAGKVRADDGKRPAEAEVKELKMSDMPRTPTSKVTVERRGQIVLIGINRPEIHNRIDPETYAALAKIYYQYDHDPSLRAAVLFGHGDNFSRGIDVDAYQALAASGRSLISDADTIDPLGYEGDTIIQAARRGGARRHLEYGPRAAPRGGYPDCRRRHPLWPGREYPRPVSWGRRHSAVRA